MVGTSPRVDLSRDFLVNILALFRSFAPVRSGSEVNSDLGSRLTLSPDQRPAPLVMPGEIGNESWSRPPSSGALDSATAGKDRFSAFLISGFSMLSTIAQRRVWSGRDKSALLPTFVSVRSHLFRLTFALTICLPDDLQMMNDPVLEQLVPVKSVFTFGRVPLDLFDGFRNVDHAVLVTSRSGTALFKTRSRIRGRRPLSLTTSTVHSRSSCYSSQRVAWSKRLLHGSMVTSRSRSLFSSGSPRATDPKVLTVRAPCRAAVRRMSSRFSLNRSLMPISDLLVSEP